MDQSLLYNRAQEMAELEQEVKLAVLRQLGKIPKIRKERDEWRHLIRDWCQTQRVPEVCGKAEEVVEWLMANPGWNPLSDSNGHQVFPDEMKEMPQEVEVTARSKIPLWYCNGKDCYKIPCKVDNPFGGRFSVHDGRYDETGFGIGTPPDIYAGEVNRCGILRERIPKVWAVNGRLREMQTGLNAYSGNMYMDLCKKGKIHITVIRAPGETVPTQTTEARHSPW